MVLVIAFTGNYFFLKYISELFNHVRTRISKNTIKFLAGIVTGIFYLVLNLPNFYPVESFLFSRPRETLQAVRESKTILCKAKINGAIVSDVSDVFSVELHGCNFLMCRYEFDSNLLEFSRLKEWYKYVDVVAIFISRKGWEHMSREDKEILREKKLIYPRIIDFADGSRLYLK